MPVEELADVDLPDTYPAAVFHADLRTAVPKVVCSYKLLARNPH